MTHLVEGLPSLTEREKHLAKSQSVAPGNQFDELKTKEEYVRGVSNWNFNSILALKESSRSGLASQRPEPIKERPEPIKERPDAIFEDFATSHIPDKTQEQQSKLSKTCYLNN